MGILKRLEKTEHASMFSGGSMLVRADDEHTEAIYPVAEWIEHMHRQGSSVYTRKVIVVEDWHEVPRS